MSALRVPLFNDQFPIPSSLRQRHSTGFHRRSFGIPRLGRRTSYGGQDGGQGFQIPDVIPNHPPSRKASAWQANYEALVTVSYRLRVKTVLMLNVKERPVNRKYLSPAEYRRALLNQKNKRS
jgi:hypothetical protein